VLSAGTVHLAANHRLPTYCVARASACVSASCLGVIHEQNRRSRLLYIVCFVMPALFWSGIALVPGGSSFGDSVVYMTSTMTPLSTPDMDEVFSTQHCFAYSFLSEQARPTLG
jgi:hypothetical protein